MAISSLEKRVQSLIKLCFVTFLNFLFDFSKDSNQLLLLVTTNQRLVGLLFLPNSGTTAMSDNIMLVTSSTSFSNSFPCFTKVQLVFFILFKPSHHCMYTICDKLFLGNAQYTVSELVVKLRTKSMDKQLSRVLQNNNELRLLLICFTSLILST